MVPTMVITIQKVKKYFRVQHILKASRKGNEIFLSVGKTLIISAGEVERVLTEDDIRQRQENQQKEKMLSMKGSGRFG